jgi:putative methionine-R-sulfoxide reductase with GAF domain
MELKALVDELIARGDDLTYEAWAEEVVKRLRADVEQYSWVGIYWRDGEELVLGPWDGPEATEHVRIDVGDGICGLAARNNETVVVDDVDEAPEYLACFPQTKSEIVVPLMFDGRAIGEIDIDSDSRAAFGDSDKSELERLADAMTGKLHV